MWVCEPGALEFPEREHASVTQRPNAALCFSGGGSRAMTASLGYYRAILSAGLLDSFRYISSVSGGSWASSIFVYYQSGAQDDAQLLDLGLAEGVAPAGLELERLGQPLPEGSMAAVIEGRLRRELFEQLLEGGEQNIWHRAVAQVYLEPFGLVDAERPLAPCLDAATRDRILARPGNAGVAGLDAEGFILPRPQRPFLVVNACIVEPQHSRRLQAQNPISLQLTPLYVGSPQPLEVRYERSIFADESLAMGGGFVESFAFGGEGPAQVESGELCTVPVEPLALDGRQTLEFAVGSSSAAYGAVVDEIPGLAQAKVLTPMSPYWPVRAGAVPKARSFDVADGGVLDNYGLLAMLQRRVERAVVFINTDSSIDLDFDPGAGESPKGKIDAYLPNLFGISVDSVGTDLQNNTVFESARFAELMREMQARRRAGKPVVVAQSLEVQANDWWGIEGGWTVQVLWVYLAPVEQWTAQLPVDTREAVTEGRAEGKQPLAHFPHYKTAGENRWGLVRLTPTQIRALAGLSEWVIQESIGELRQLLEGA